MTISLFCSLYSLNCRRIRMTTRKITTIALLTSLASVLRISMGAFPNIKPITALFFVLILYIGLVDAILVSALTMVVTGIVMGFSIIIIGQILSYAIILVLGSFLLSLVFNIILRTWFIFILTLCYGFFLSLSSVYLFGSPIMIFCMNRFSVDLTHAISTAIFFPILLTIFNLFWQHEKL